MPDNDPVEQRDIDKLIKMIELPEIQKALWDAYVNYAKNFTTTNATGDKKNIKKGINYGTS